ncbi:MAG: aldo/keto reductase, partial [Solimonas sp.]
MDIETLRIAGIPTPVSRVALGTWAIGGWKWGGTEESDAIATIQAAVDAGINLIDTAPVYGFGRSEERVGKALAGGRRQRAVIATKVCMNWDAGHKVFRDSRPARIRQEIEDSLRRLGTDYIDLYQVHWPDTTVAIEDTAAELDKLRQAGKILAIGVSNYSPAQMAAFRTAAPLASVQPPYNLFERGGEADVLPYAQDAGLAVLAYGPLCRGLLSGRISETTSFEGDDLRGYDPKFVMPRRLQYLAAVSALDALARQRHGRGVLALAVRWVLDRGNTIALWGARRPAQLAPVGEAFGWSLSADDMAEIEAILARTVT